MTNIFKTISKLSLTNKIIIAIAFPILLLGISTMIAKTISKREGSYFFSETWLVWFLFIGIVACLEFKIYETELAIMVSNFNKQQKIIISIAFPLLLLSITIAFTDNLDAYNHRDHPAWWVWFLYMGIVSYFEFILFSNKEEHLKVILKEIKKVKVSEDIAGYALIRTYCDQRGIIVKRSGAIPEILMPDPPAEFFEAHVNKEVDAVIEEVEVKPYSIKGVDDILVTKNKIWLVRFKGETLEEAIRAHGKTPLQ